MSSITYKTLSQHIAGNLNGRIKEFQHVVGEISENFKNLGLEIAVWYPEKIHTVNIGGIDADSYIGYSRVEGRWGLVLRTLEHDHESHEFVSQRVSNLESCGSVDIVVNALTKVPDLVLCIHETVTHQIEALSHAGNKIGKLRNPECGF